MGFDTALVGVISHSFGKLGACKCLQVNKEGTTQKKYVDFYSNIRYTCIK